MLRKLLIIDDEENMRHMLSVLTSKAGYTVTLSADGHQALEAVAKEHFDFILCDLKMPAMSGLDFLKELRARGIETVVIMMSAYGSIDTAVEAMRCGAYDFITKPFKTDEVLLALKKAGETEELRRENLLLKKEIQNLQGAWSFGAMVGEDRAMKELVTLAGKVAKHNSTVLITGESGTGKELLAKGIYLSGGRSDKPFVAVNCGSIPEALLESEFFGYCKGAFTGADTNKKGLFEEANGGTLFLDEIGELPLALQVKLLRVLQENEIRPIGSNKQISIDSRIIAATAKDLGREVEKGSFRKDLFYRLNVINLRIPPLRDRSADIPVLCEHLINKLNKRLGSGVTSISPSAINQLLKYSWPGNVRELENVMERGLVFSEGDTLQCENLPKNLSEKTGSGNLESMFTSCSMKVGKATMERLLIVRALEMTAGNKSKAATLLEVSYPSLLQKIKQYDIE